MKKFLPILFFLASIGFSDSKSDTTIVPKKAGGAVNVSGGTGGVNITGGSTGSVTITGGSTSGQVLIKAATVNVRASEGTGTTTLISTDIREQIFNLSAARTVKLPSTGIAKGDKWTFKNVASGNYALTIESSGAATTLTVVNSIYAVAEAVALVNNPSAAADWNVNLSYTRKQYLIGTAYNGGVTPTLSGTAYTSLTRGVLVPYQTQSGIWRMTFNIDYNTSSTTSADIELSGVSWNGTSAITVVTLGSMQTYLGRVYNITGIVARAVTNAETHWLVSGDFELTSRPTWAY